MAYFDIFSDLSLIGRPGLSQGGQAFYREAGPLTGMPSLSQRGRAFHREARPLTGRLGLSHGGRASHMEAKLFTRRLSCSQGGWTSYREVGPLTGRPGLLQGRLVFYREAGPLTGKLGLSQGATASHRAIHNSQKIVIKSIFSSNIKLCITHESCLFGFSNTTAKNFTLLASQNLFSIETVFLRSSTFRGQSWHIVYRELERLQRL